MKITIHISEYEIKQIRDFYSETASSIPDKELVKIIVEDILCRYLGPEYFDLEMSFE